MTGRPTTENLKLYAVISPEYGEVIPLLDDGTGPVEWGCDWTEIYAANAADAKALVVGLWLRGSYRDEGKWAREQRSMSESPYRGVTVEEIPCHCAEVGLEDCSIHKPRSWSA